jgi:hypothetical protein
MPWDSRKDTMLLFSGFVRLVPFLMFIMAQVSLNSRKCQQLSASKMQGRRDLTPGIGAKFRILDEQQPQHYTKGFPLNPQLPGRKRVGVLPMAFLLGELDCKPMGNVANHHAGSLTSIFNDSHGPRLFLCFRFHVLSIAQFHEMSTIFILLIINDLREIQVFRL